ncbi:uncharacterized protein LOC111331108 isoform X3 [Stylophora pistillata]|uniref:uncharacterized protein LOC111331108 isoform X3 n=1 Tax=Stylophora pistillata TaxID=50429 RepID=UPI000C055C66|nr:uncharacterized protein LOC111331108 isoform X3 [Stylophora pistillata]
MSFRKPTEEEKHKFMGRAIALSDEGPSKGHGGPFGAVIVKDGQIIGEGFNREVIDCDPTAHGEMTAIRQACKNIKSTDLSGCEIYTSWEPCAMCSSAIWLCRLDRLYYGNRYEDTESLINVTPLFQYVATPTDQRSTPAEQVRGKEV